MGPNDYITAILSITAIIVSWVSLKESKKSKRKKEENDTKLFYNHIVEILELASKLSVKRIEDVQNYNNEEDKKILSKIGEVINENNDLIIIKGGWGIPQSLTKFKTLAFQFNSIKDLIPESESDVYIISKFWMSLYGCFLSFGAEERIHRFIYHNHANRSLSEMRTLYKETIADPYNEFESHCWNFLNKHNFNLEPHISNSKFHPKLTLLLN